MGFLTGKTVIITGGGRAVLENGKAGSIGYGIATAYAKEGANITITGRNVKKLEEAGISAAVIGSTNNSNDKTVINEEETRYLEPPVPDEIYKVFYKA